LAQDNPVIWGRSGAQIEARKSVLDPCQAKKGRAHILDGAQILTHLRLQPWGSHDHRHPGGGLPQAGSVVEEAVLE
jgi:hypothetical protein